METDEELAAFRAERLKTKYVRATKDQALIAAGEGYKSQGRRDPARSAGQRRRRRMNNMIRLITAAPALWWTWHPNDPATENKCEIAVISPFDFVSGTAFPPVHGYLVRERNGFAVHYTLHDGSRVRIVFFETKAACLQAVGTPQP